MKITKIAKITTTVKDFEPGEVYVNKLNNAPYIRTNTGLLVGLRSGAICSENSAKREDFEHRPEAELIY